MRCILQSLLICIVTVLFIVAGSYYLARSESAAVETVSEVEMIPVTTAVPVIKSDEYEENETVPEIFATEPPPSAEIHSIPKLYQSDYPYQHFGNGTIATSGCSITCLAMVGSYLTDHAYYPDQMAYHFGDFGKNNIERLEYGCQQMKLPYKKTDNVVDALNALKEGKVVIAMMGEASIFTDEQHFIVLAGMTNDDKIIVHDPLETQHATDVYIKNAFESGFGAHDIMRGFSGAWIFDKNDFPADFEPYDASIPEEQAGRYKGLELTGEEYYLLACFLWAEARTQPLDVQRAIVEVIFNRVISTDFPNTVHDVLYKGEYYGVLEKTKYAEVQNEQYIAIDMTLNGPNILPVDVLYFSIWDTRGEHWGTLGPYTFIYSR